MADTYRNKEIDVVAAKVVNANKLKFVNFSPAISIYEISNQSETRQLAYCEVFGAARRPGGVTRADLGTWIVQYGDGDLAIMTEEAFNEEFQPV